MPFSTVGVTRIPLLNNKIRHVSLTGLIRPLSFIEVTLILFSATLASPMLVFWPTKTPYIRPLRKRTRRKASSIFYVLSITALSPFSGTITLSKLKNRTRDTCLMVSFHVSLTRTSFAYSSRKPFLFVRNPFTPREF